MAAVVDVPGARSVLAWVTADSVDALDASVARFRQLYDGDRWAGSVSVRVDPSARTAVLVAANAPVELGEITVWGAPRANETVDLEAVVDDPAASTALHGLFVVLRDRNGIRAVTSANLAHTVSHARGDGVHAWATRGIAAAVAAGVRLRVAPERVPELLLYDFVIGDDELLDAVDVLHEAAVVDARGGEGAVSYPVPRERRLARGAPTSPADIVRAVHDLADVVRPAGDAWLGVTAGRDSSLLVRGIAQRGVRGRAFTLGWRGLEDADAGAAMCRALHWTHELAGIVPPDRGRNDAWDEIVAAAPWTEGMENPRAIALGSLDWERTDVTWLSGHGGEIGRGFYWGGRAAASPLDLLLHRVPSTVRADTRSALGARLETELTRADAFDRRGVDGLDAFYALNRMRKWVARVRPYEQFANIWPGYLGPDLVRVLLDLPHDARGDGSGFDAALALVGAPARVPAAASALPSRSVLVRARRAVGLRRKTGGDWPLLRPVLSAMGPPERVVLPVMGAPWWADVYERATSQPAAQRMAWNVIGIEAFATWLAGRDAAD